MHLESPRFTVEIRPDRSRAVVEVEGELDIATVAMVRDAFDGLRDAGWQSLVLDARRLTFADSRGLQLLVELDRDARTNAWRFSLADGSPPLEWLLQLTGLEQQFDRVRLR